MNFKLVIKYPLTNASADIFDQVLMIETQLELVLRGNHKVDGHEIKPKEIDIIIHTNSPDDVLTLIKNELSEKDLSVVTIAYSDIEENKYSVIWPENYNQAF